MPLQNEMGNFETTQTLETFGFLPKFDMNEIQAQIAYIIANGWAPAIEHEHPSNSFDHYWTCLLYTSPSPRDGLLSRMPSSA